MRIRQSHLEAELGRPAAAPVEQALEDLQRLEARAFEGYAFFVLGRIAEIAGEVEGARRRYRQSIHRRRDTLERTALAEVLGDE